MIAYIEGSEKRDRKHCKILTGYQKSIIL